MACIKTVSSFACTLKALISSCMLSQYNRLPFGSGAALMIECGVDMIFPTRVPFLAEQTVKALPMVITKFCGPSMNEFPPMKALLIVVDALFACMGHAGSPVFMLKARTVYGRIPATEFCPTGRIKLTRSCRPPCGPKTTRCTVPVNGMKSPV